MAAIGIDLGTTNSVAAIGADPKVILSSNKEQLTPSGVSYNAVSGHPGEGQIVVGRDAVHNAQRDPVNTIFSIKRLMGRLYGEKWDVYGIPRTLQEVQAHVPYRIADPPPPEVADHGVKV